MLKIVLLKTCHESVYFEYKNFDEYRADIYNLKFIRLLNDNNQNIISVELHRTGNNCFKLVFAYDDKGAVTIEEWSNTDIEIKPRTDINELWYDAIADYLYVPYKIYNEILLEEIIAVDTKFTKNKELSNKS